VVGFQPSEFAKLAFIIFLSVFITNTIGTERSHFRFFLKFAGIAGLVSGLVLMQPNMSTAMLIMAIGVSIYFVSGADLKPLFISAPFVLLLAVIFMLSSSYRRERLMTLITHDASKVEQSGYHINQVQIALGSGGFAGLGFGQSRQKYQYLPEVASDSIFAIIGEELGFVGTTFVVAVFVYLFYKGLCIAAEAPDLLGRLLAVGVSCWIGLQFFVNIAAMTKIIPLTGVPIPLISYGGSSMVFSLMALGILANISRKV
jgi:cell division protein FtsW